MCVCVHVYDACMHVVVVAVFVKDSLEIYRYKVQYMEKFVQKYMVQSISGRVRSCSDRWAASLGYFHITFRLHNSVTVSDFISTAE